MAMTVSWASKELACDTPTSYRLPLEILLDIINTCLFTYKSELEGIDEQAVSRTLRAFALTSHAFLSHSQSHLFRTVKLTRQSLYEKFLSCLQSSSARCRDDLGVGKHVKELVLWESHLSIALHGAFQELEPKLPRLSLLELRCDSGFDPDKVFFSGLNVISQTITHLELTASFKTFDDWSRFIMSFTRLDSLSCIGTSFQIGQHNPPIVYPPSEGGPNDPTRYLRSLKCLKISSPPIGGFPSAINWFASIFCNGTALEELSVTFHRFHSHEDVVALNRLFQQCGSTLRRLDMSTHAVPKVSGYLDPSPLKKLESFTLNGHAYFEDNVVIAAQDMSTLIRNPSCPMAQSITSVKITCFLPSLRLRSSGNTAATYTARVRHERATKAVKALHAFDEILDHPAFVKLEDIFIRLTLSTPHKEEPRGLRLHGLFPKMKAKMDARAAGGDSRVSNGLVVRVWDEEDCVWFNLQ
ncbi:hypothetical protein DENSPDRAFT_405313 [Dentipellis sp. KUC8613]|nr:hypothetical protein DENSPDRAFT_405313 [Dentipellis sp. KUC8613]